MTDIPTIWLVCTFSLRSPKVINEQQSLFIVRTLFTPQAVVAT